jgi:NADPH:quinone reductase
VRAILCHGTEGPDALTLGEIAQPQPGPAQVRIGVHAVGINFADTLMVTGRYQERPAYPFAPGMEVAGRIEAVGPDVLGFAPGDRVMAAVGSGGLAESVVTPVENTFRLPAGIDFAIAASLPVAYGTAHLALTHRAQLRAGEALLVLGAAGGAGLAAVEVGRALGAQVIGAARGADRLALVRERGAQATIDYTRENLRERVRELTQDRGADVIFDAVGGDAFDAALRCIAWEGRLLVIGFASGRIPQAPANLLLVKNCAALGFYWGTYRTRMPKLVRESFATLLTWTLEGKIRPHIAHRFALADSGKAIRLLMDRQATGKAVVLVREAEL